MTLHGSARGPSARNTPEGGAAATWLALALSGVSGAALVVHLERRVEAVGFHLVDPARVLQRAGPSVDGGWWDDRWRRELEWELASTPPFALGDAGARAALRERVAALSFVAEVRPGQPAEVVWPDGLRLALCLERPAACVELGGRFRPVSERGVLLSGTWPTPPTADGGPLPVLGPNDGRMAGARAGELLAEPHEYAALSIAVSLREHLGATDRERLGRVLIDARRAHLAAPDEPGARLFLEGGRQVYWGRDPDAGEPGELPASIKWAHVVRGLDALERGIDWRVLDVRWDRPAMDREAFGEARNKGAAVGAASSPALLPVAPGRLALEPAAPGPAGGRTATSGVR